jgi:hypothetical protein
MATNTGATPPVTPDTQSTEIPHKPAPGGFQSPVAWLFGRQLIANLKWILLYTAFSGKLDHRDWMKAEVIPDVHSLEEVEQFWRGWNETWAAADDGNPQSDKEFWFDYISDTGDGQKAVYSLAYLCMSDLAVGENPQPGERLELAPEPDAATLKTQGKMLLPRGTFLFVGGDTSYHISDYGNLANRFQNPFWWAYRDLRGRASSVMGKLPRLLFGIPGNHDWYDSLDGFNRQFRKPSTGDDAVVGGRPPLLRIPTFSRRQEASYVALRLPFDWWFWGLDTEQGVIDFRQLEFFKDIQNRYAPRKLIVATPEPTTAFGQFIKEDENASKTFAALGLKRPFLKEPEPLGEGQCRVDLSGDIHHYARYWGPPPASTATSNYASVMSGGGGAFFHPSQTNVREVPQQMLYPPEKASRDEVADQLFKFRNIWSGGWVWLFGGLIAFALFFAASFPQSSKDATDSFPLWVNLGVSPPTSRQSAEPLTSYVKPMFRYTWGPNAPPMPPGFFVWIISLVVSLGAMGAALIYSGKLFSQEYEPTRTKPPNEVKLPQRLVIWALVLVGFVSLAYGLWGFATDEPNLTRYARSLIILAALLWGVLAAVASTRYSEWLFQQAYRENIKAWRYWPIWALLILAVVGIGAALWVFGKHESAFLVSDLVQVIVLLAVGLGLIYFAYGTGAGLKKGIGKVGFLLLGASHALLQLAVPFLLVRKGHLLWAPLAVLALCIVFKFIGRALAKLKNGWPLAIAWVLFGAALLVIPFYLHSTGLHSLNMPDTRGMKFLLCFYAAAIGAVMSCVLFGGYLAVSLAFDGHNNEAGGAARIEGFKQFIRFRINRRGLTGYVIAIDKPSTEGTDLQPKIVDVFHLSER